MDSNFFSDVVGVDITRSEIAFCCSISSLRLIMLSCKISNDNFRSEQLLQMLASFC